MGRREERWKSRGRRQTWPIAFEYAMVHTVMAMELPMVKRMLAIPNKPSAKSLSVQDVNVFSTTKNKVGDDKDEETREGETS